MTKKRQATEETAAVRGGHSVKTVDDDATMSQAEKAFAVVEPRLASVTLPKVPARLNFELAALAATGIAARVTTGALHASFAAIPAKLFNGAQLVDLGPLAWATYYAGRKYNLARSGESEAKLPTSLVAKATLVEGRMMRLCEYHFSKDPELGPVVAALHPGSTYRDLAGDLQGYAAIYRERAAVVKADPTNYVATDLPDALALSQEIFDTLTSAETKEAKLWGDRARRGFVLLEPVHKDVCATGLWLERADATAPARYVSLYAAGREGVGKHGPRTPPGGGGGAGGGGGGAAGGGGGGGGTPPGTGSGMPTGSGSTT